MRVGEAIGLDRDDLDLEQGLLTIRHGKFGKSRQLPLHPSTVEALLGYARPRPRASAVARRRGRASSSRRPEPGCSGTTPARCSPGWCDDARLDWAGRRRPRLHDLRHRFAVRTVLGWYRAGLGRRAPAAAAVDLPRPRRTGVDLLVPAARSPNCSHWSPSGSTHATRWAAMSTLAPLLEAFFTERLIGPARRQPAHHRRLPRHVPPAAALRAAHAPASRRPSSTLDRPRRPADRRVPRPSGDRAGRQRAHPQRPAHRHPLPVRVRRLPPPRARRGSSNACSPSHPSASTGPWSPSSPHPRSTRCWPPGPPHPDRAPRPRPAPPRRPDRAARLRADRAHLRRRRTWAPAPTCAATARAARNGSPRSPSRPGRCCAAWLTSAAAYPAIHCSPGPRGGPLSRDAVRRLVARHVATASSICPSLAAKHDHPPRAASQLRHAAPPGRRRHLGDRALARPRRRPDHLRSTCTPTSASKNAPWPAPRPRAPPPGATGPPTRCSPSSKPVTMQISEPNAPA